MEQFSFDIEKELPNGAVIIFEDLVCFYTVDQDDDVVFSSVGYESRGENNRKIVKPIEEPWLLAIVEQEAYSRIDQKCAELVSDYREGQAELAADYKIDCQRDLMP